MFRPATQNPFVPGSDRVPAVWAGRTEQLADWERVVRARRVAGEYERGRVLLGEPGVGKSVLANRIGELAAQQGDIVVPQLRVPRGADALALLAEHLDQTFHAHDLGRHVADGISELLARVRRVAQVEIAAGRPPTNPHVPVRDLLVELAGVAMADRRAIVVQIDEVQNVASRDVLSQLLVALGDAAKHTVPAADAAGNRHERVLPIVVYLTGLPEFTSRATSIAGATFIRRFRPELLTHLSDVEIRVALELFTTDGWPVLTDDGPAQVVMDSQAVDRIIRYCLGDPFLFQLVGNAAWDADADGQTITAVDVDAGWQRVRREARGHVERLVERIPAREREVLDVLVELASERRTLSAVATVLDATPSELSGYAARLEDRGIIERGKPYRIVARTVEAHVAGRWP